MSTEHAAPATDTSRGTALAPPPGLDATLAHPLLGRMLRGQSHRRWLDHEHPWLLDTAVVLLVLGISLPDLLQGGGISPFGDSASYDEASTGVALAFTAALALPLWWRRRAPTVTYFVIATVSLIHMSLDLWLPAGISALIALYTLARQGSLRVLGWAAAVAATEVVLAVCVLVPVEHPLLGSFFLLGTTTASVTIGLTLRIRQMYLGALEDRARRLEVEQEQRVRLTAAAERARVAREMHDIVGHNLSVMVSVADGAAMLAANRQEQTADALQILADTGRQAMSELRRVLGVLRDDQDEKRPLSPQPAIRDLDPLLARVRAAGLKVSYRTAGDLESLGSGVQLTVYRTVQEALTNTLKHAGVGSSAEVTVTAEAGAVRVRVADTGVPPGVTVRPIAEPRGDDPGHGLVGIRQRAAMYGGTVTIGPRDLGHGWLVNVVLDVPAASAPSLPGQQSVSGDHLP
ncbi:sensor histidine kinase [Streptomyces justiciae]|uniref:sensor histidine kinase n=1 Tax=Streptomyces justiciae TaxID=2780140 RepID=UPI0021194012|nr:histidine kinase [Streptomyces justiciae]MCW8378681.1 histidine kinase [Streptomyces justiciae]